VSVEQERDEFAQAFLDLWAAEGNECGHGVGLDADCEGESETCWHCHGTGQVRTIGTVSDCPRCEGKGSFHQDCHWQPFRTMLRKARDLLGGTVEP
jgi:DnaJ-class molecular chaperone